MTITVVEESKEVSVDDLNSLSDAADQDEEENTISMGKELSKIVNILISTCCVRFCLQHLTGTDVMDFKRELVQ